VCSSAGLLRGAGEEIKKIVVEGNSKVETAAILAVVGSKLGERLDDTTIAQDIRAINSLGYFSKVDVFQEPSDTGTILYYVLVENPAIVSISFIGLSEIKEDDFKKALQTKLYTIVDEATITADMRMLERRYAEKGFFLTKVTYSLASEGKNEVALTFHVDERGKVLVGEVNILGAKFFSPAELIDKFATRPYTRWSAGFGASSIFNEEFIKRDLEFLSYYYRDFGFADVKVGKPIINLDQDRRMARVTFEVEEGEQYYLGSLSISGDVGAETYEPEVLLKKMLLKPEALFRYSQFSKDVEVLVDQYGDLGYAYADINPITSFDKEKRRVDINYKITKGEKVYFGTVEIVGNTKTRDNVIRREMEVADSELYSGTRLTESRNNINRLGFFEEVQISKERNLATENVLDLKVKVKEKSTGQFQAALGYSPSGATAESLFGQLRYDEKNQSGRGWNFNLTGKYGGKDNWKGEIGFYDPKVYDSVWSLGLNYSYERVLARFNSLDSPVPQIDRSVSVTVGRALFELVRGSVTLRHSLVTQLQRRSDIYLGLTDNSGVKNSLILGLSRRDLDNYIDPTKGVVTTVRHYFHGGKLGGKYSYMEDNIENDLYIPVDFTDTYRTYFKIHGMFGKLWPYHREKVPSQWRYQLGGPFDLRGFPYASIGPSDRVGVGPFGNYQDINIGGDRKLYFQLEYFMPLIPQAGIKALVFADLGRVYREDQNLNFDFNKVSKDVGFGLRWITPIAPFRFEWAYPYNDATRSFGEMQFIFNIGY
jgi:outer membrane protein insertion porin family